jgi:hypothetical protein
MSELVPTRFPPLFGEDYLSALLLRMVLEHCGTMKACELSDFTIEANADAIRALADAGLIRIVDEANGRIRATPLPSAETLIARYQADKVQPYSNPS